MPSHRSCARAAGLAIVASSATWMSLATAQAEADPEAHADAPAVAEPAPTGPAAPAPADPAADANPTAAPPEQPAATAETAALAESTPAPSRADLEARIAALEAREARREREAEEAELGDILAAADQVEAEVDVLDLYGFFDIGFQKIFISDSSFFYPLITTRSSTFLIGNLNLFLDAKPHDDWRGLVELRFTNLPHGDETSFGSPLTDYERVDRRFSDSTNPNGRNQVLLGSTIIERVWGQYTASDALQLRVGSWFTPYGIWNIDHGSPTLISLLLPNSQISEYFPLRQLGVQALGTFHTTPWEIGYHAYVSNGRTQTMFDLTEDKAFGGRLFAAHAAGSTTTKLGVSGYWGTFTDERKDITSFDPFTVDITETIAAEEWGLAADASLDSGPFRLRTEAVVHRIDYEDGKRPANANNPTAFEPDEYEWDAYILGAYRLPWAGLEPYLWMEYIHSASSIGDTVLFPAVGLNIHFTPQVQLKSQYGRPTFIDTIGDSDPSVNNFGIFTSRFVMAY